MNKYTVTFQTKGDWAQANVYADTPDDALSQARCLAEDDLGALDFESYGDTQGVERIEVFEASGRPAAEWRHPDLLIRLAAPQVLKAAEAVISAWEGGDLAAAVRRLAAAVAVARTGESQV